MINFDFLKYRKIFLLFSGILVGASILAMVLFGFKLGIEFTGGSILELEFQNSRPQNQVLQEKLAPLKLGEILIQPIGEKGVVLRMKEIGEEDHQKILEILGKEAKGVRFEMIGPLIGKELKKKTKNLTILSLLVILIYIAFAFRKLKYPRRSWQYGIAATIALFHDVIIPLGIFSLLGKFLNVPLTIPIIVALLTIIGYSINDTVVYFDRIRENLFKKRGLSFGEVINLSLNQTIFRSLNTSLTTLFPLLAIFFFGGETLKYFSLALIIGIIAGTYSSIFIAPPILFSWPKFKFSLPKRG